MTDQQKGAASIAFGLFFIVGGIRLIMRKAKIYKKAYQGRAVSSGWFVILYGICISSAGIYFMTSR